MPTVNESMSEPSQFLNPYLQQPQITGFYSATPINYNDALNNVLSNTNENPYLSTQSDLPNPNLTLNEQYFGVSVVPEKNPVVYYSTNPGLSDFDVNYNTLMTENIIQQPLSVSGIKTGIESIFDST
jgi:hypothetical protein